MTKAQFLINDVGVKILSELYARNMRPCELGRRVKCTTPKLHRTLHLLIKMGLVSRRKLFHEHAKHAVLYSLMDERAKEFVKALRRFVETHR